MTQDNVKILLSFACENFLRSQFMFLHASPEVWNLLPLSLRGIENMPFMKKRLKVYYFNLAVNRILHKIFDQCILHEGG